MFRKLSRFWAFSLMIALAGSVCTPGTAIRPKVDVRLVRPMPQVESVPWLKAELRFTNRESVGCELVGYRLQWSAGNKDVVLSQPVHLGAGSSVTRTVDLAAAGSPDELADLTGSARCEPK